MNEDVELFGFYKLLDNDLKKSIAILNDLQEKDSFDFYTRVYFRAYASWIEGAIYVYKDVIRNIEYKWYSELPTAAQLYIFEYDWKQRSSGEPIIQEHKKIKTLDNLKGLFFVCSLLFKDFSVDLEKSFWSDIVFFYSKRDMMMHPKSISDLAVSKEEINRCERGREWLNSVFTDLSSSILKKIDSCEKIELKWS